MNKGRYNKDALIKYCNENENKNKILINYFNSMYIDCINFSKNIVKNEDESQCDFIKKKINRLNHPPDNSKLRHHIIYAVAK